MYDWANSAFATTIIAAIFPVFFTAVARRRLAARRSDRRLARTTTIAAGDLRHARARYSVRIADYAPIKKRLLGLFIAIGSLASGGLFLVLRGDWHFAAVLFAIGNIGFAASLTFYDSLLPHMASEE